MSANFVTYDPSGYWEGEGVEVRILQSDNSIQQVKLRLTQLIRNCGENVYVATGTYYYEDGSLNYGPADILISTSGNNNCIASDEYAGGVDTYLFSSEKMTFIYNINGIPESIDPLFKSLDGVYNLVKKNVQILEKQAALFKNVDSNIQTNITDNKIIADGITEADFPVLEFIVDNNKVLDFSALTICLDKNGILTPIVVPGVYDIVKAKYDVVAKEALSNGSNTFEPFKTGVLGYENIGQIIDQLTNQETLGILKVFCITLTDTSM